MGTTPFNISTWKMSILIIVTSSLSVPVIRTGIYLILLIMKWLFLKYIFDTHKISQWLLVMCNLHTKCLHGVKLDGVALVLLDSANLILKGVLHP